MVNEEPGNDPDLFTQEEIDFYVLAVFHGIITTHNLSATYHTKVSSFLVDGLNKGFGSHEGVNLSITYTDLRHNIYVFSAAKQYQQVRTMSKMISETADFPNFKKKADVVFDAYNKNYLKTEFTTAIGQSQSARDWVDAEAKKDVYPLVRYQTQRDARVRDLHRALDGITLPINHPFWNNNAPKNGWNCRCFLTSHDRSEKVTNLKEKNLTDLEDKTKFPDIFKFNPGKDKIVFDPKTHPYFRVAKGDLHLKKNNFGLVAP